MRGEIIYPKEKKKTQKSKVEKPFKITVNTHTFLISAVSREAAYEKAREFYRFLCSK